MGEDETPGKGGDRELLACPGPGLNNFFSRVRVGPGPIFSFNQIHFDFSLKSKYDGAKVNV